MKRPKMTLEQLRALRPVWEPVAPVVITGATESADAAATLARLVNMRDLLVRKFASAAEAGEWLNRNPRVARAYRVAKLYCPRGKLLGEMYCLPEGSPPVRDSGGHRLLIRPASRGRLAALAGDDDNDRDRGEAWWYITDEDVWDLSCRCCRRPEGGIRAGFFLGVVKGTGYDAVLA